MKNQTRTNGLITSQDARAWLGALGSLAVAMLLFTASYSHASSVMPNQTFVFQGVPGGFEINFGHTDFEPGGGNASTGSTTSWGNHPTDQEPNPPAGDLDAPATVSVRPDGNIGAFNLHGFTGFTRTETTDEGDVITWATYFRIIGWKCYYTADYDEEFTSGFPYDGMCTLSITTWEVPVLKNGEPLSPEDPLNYESNDLGSVQMDVNFNHLTT